MLKGPEDVLHALCVSLSLPANNMTGQLLEVKFYLLISTSDGTK
jgi:hypothetical protein